MCVSERSPLVPRSLVGANTAADACAQLRRAPRRRPPRLPNMFSPSPGLARNGRRAAAVHQPGQGRRTRRISRARSGADATDQHPSPAAESTEATDEAQTGHRDRRRPVAAPGRDRTAERQHEPETRLNRHRTAVTQRDVTCDVTCGVTRGVGRGVDGMRRVASGPGVVAPESRRGHRD